MADLNSLIVLKLDGGEGALGSIFLAGCEVEGELSFGLGGLSVLDDSLGSGNNRKSLSDGSSGGNLLSLNLLEVIDDSDVSVRNIDDVVG